MQIYEMARSEIEHLSESSDAAALNTAMAALSKQQVAIQYPHPAAVLQEQRTFHIPRPENLKGSAIFVAQVSSNRTEKVELISGDERLRSQAEVLAHLDLHLAIPPNSKALLLRSGVLFCSEQPNCEFVLTPPAQANIR